MKRSLLKGRNLITGVRYQVTIEGEINLKTSPVKMAGIPSKYQHDLISIIFRSEGVNKEKFQQKKQNFLNVPNAWRILYFYGFQYYRIE